MIERKKEIFLFTKLCLYYRDVGSAMWRGKCRASQN